MTRRGFAAGQSGASAEQFQVLFCASYDDFVNRFPTIDHTDYRPGTGACVDFHVNGTENGGATDADLEGLALSEVLRNAGCADAAASIDSLRELDPEDAVDTIATAISQLLPASLS